VRTARRASRGVQKMDGLDETEILSEMEPEKTVECSRFETTIIYLIRAEKSP